MGWCRACGYEYREGIQVCPDCGRELEQATIAQEPAEETAAPGGEPVTVFVTSDEIEAELVRGLLESSGIEVWMRTDNMRSVYPGPARFPHEQISLIVQAERSDEARAVIEQAKRDGGRE